MGSRYFFSHKIIYDVLPAALDSVGPASHFFRGGGIAAAAAVKKEVK